MKITSCNNCPFIGGGDLPFCQHPLIHQDPKKNFKNELEGVHIGNGMYPLMNPPFCPLRPLKQIDIGCIVEIDLDTNLFQENFKK